MQGVLLAERFRIRDRLGAGGMGQVWSAQDERMRRDVAVKIVHPQFGMDEAETQARFQREVQLAGRLSHQNIVTVHDWGEVSVDGRHTLYLVMELVPGVPLHKRFRESLAPWPLAVGWAAQISRALDAAHGRGVVHRDIKPANVLLTPEGTVKVLDFGVAKFMGETIGARDLTVTGAPLGSPAYMSPEQAEGLRDLDHRSDLYSLGCLLYHAVTGRPPFASTTQWAVLRMQMEDTPPAPDTLVEGLPGGLNDLILSLLAKRPADRPPDAAAVFDALCTVLVDHAVTLPAGDILDAARLGQGEALSGRLLDKAWGLWRSTQRHGAALRAEAERLRDEAAADASTSRAEGENIAVRLRSEAAAEAELLAASAVEALTAAREEAHRRRREAEELLGSARQEADRQREQAREQSEELLASARKRVEEAQAEAVRLVEEADRRATTTVSKAERTAQRVRDSVAGLREEAQEEIAGLRSAAEHAAERMRAEATDETKAYRAKTVELQEEARRLRGEAGSLLAESELIRAQARREVDQQFADAVRAAGATEDGPGEAAAPRPSDTPAAGGIRAEPLPDGRARAAAAVTSPAFRLTRDRRGYDRAQVDERVGRLLFARDGARERVAELRSRIVEDLAPSVTGRVSPGALDEARSLAESFIAGAYTLADQEIEARPVPLRPHPYEFALIRRGYDCNQVDDRIVRLIAERDLALARVTALERFSGGRL
ncbi:protein kinase [Streptomyces sp. NPDC127072]|uniref:protein kinase domain-containing protein n=1 Tax=Streptomyces sp. NPDC127072 TaxID=3347129 RepID=UPI003655E290